MAEKILSYHFLKFRNKVGCAFLMVVVSMLPTRKLDVLTIRKTHPHFNKPLYTVQANQFENHATIWKDQFYSYLMIVEAVRLITAVDFLAFLRHFL